MFKSLSVAVSAVVLVASQSVFAAVVPNITAAELACHRIERLVTLKKVDAGFLTQFEKLTIELLSNGGVAKPTFKIVVGQETDTGKEANRVELTLDENGKALSQTVLSGQPASNPVVWPAKDPVTLVELALHHVIDNSSKAGFSHFVRAMDVLTIVPAKLNGVDVARIEIGTSHMASTLIVFVALDGKILSDSILQ